MGKTKMSHSITCANNDSMKLHSALRNGEWRWRDGGGQWLNGSKALVHRQIICQLNEQVKSMKFNNNLDSRKKIFNIVYTYAIQ